MNKRFRFQDKVYDEVFLKKIIYDSVSEREYDCTLKCQDDLCVLLNELNDENKKLRIVNEMMSADMVGTERELNEKIETLEKEIVKLENGWKYLLEENTRLEKFFLYNCKSQDFIDWVKMLAEKGENDEF